jgi:hypothetical protein
MRGDFGSGLPPSYLLYISAWEEAPRERSQPPGKQTSGSLQTYPEASVIAAQAAEKLATPACNEIVNSFVGF